MNLRPELTMSKHDIPMEREIHRGHPMEKLVELVELDLERELDRLLAPRATPITFENSVIGCDYFISRASLDSLRTAISDEIPLAPGWHVTSSGATCLTVIDPDGRATLYSYTEDPRPTWRAWLNMPNT